MIDCLFCAFELRSTYLVTQSDFHTHARDLPLQMGDCYHNVLQAHNILARWIYNSPWSVFLPGTNDPATSQVSLTNAASISVCRVLRHRHTLCKHNFISIPRIDKALRCALMFLQNGVECESPVDLAKGHC